MVIVSTDPSDPRLSDEEVDALFAGLVADWEPSADPTQETPVEPAPATPVESQPSAPTPPWEDPHLDISIPVWRGATGPSIDEVVQAEDDEGFVPPEVSLPPGEDLHYWGAVVGLVSGPLVLLWVLFANPFYRGWWITGGLALLIGGFCLVVLRSPRDRDPEDDDSGARL